GDMGLGQPRSRYLYARGAELDRKDVLGSRWEGGGHLPLRAHPAATAIPRGASSDDEAAHQPSSTTKDRRLRIARKARPQVLPLSFCEPRRGIRFERTRRPSLCRREGPASLRGVFDAKGLRASRREAILRSADFARVRFRWRSMRWASPARAPRRPPG